MSKLRATALVLAVSALSAAAPAHATCVPYGFVATLTAYTGSGSGIPASPIPLPAQGSISTSLLSYTSTSFSIASGVFVRNEFVPSATANGGTVPLPTAPNSIYILGQIVNQSSRAGSFAAGAGPGGGFGGTLGTGMNLTALLGIAPLPSIYGSLVLPLNAGSSGTVTAMANILGNAVTVTVSGKAWTTGTITYNDGNLGTTTGGTAMAAVVNPFVTSGTAMGSNALAASAGTITLVAPITIKIPGTGADLRAGYQVLQLFFVPEPGSLLLLAGAAALLALGRAR